MLDVLLTVPHGAPGNDALAPFVAKALHERLKGMGYRVKTLISLTCRYTDTDMNRDDGRGSEFRSTVRAAIEEGPPKLHIDVHSFPDEIPRFGHQDIVLLHGYEHPDTSKPLQDREWLRKYSRLLCGHDAVSACVQPSAYPNDVCQHVIDLGMPRDRTMLAEHYNSGNPVAYAAAHAHAISQIIPLGEISQHEPQQHSPGVAGTTGGGGLASPTQFGPNEGDPISARMDDMQDQSGSGKHAAPLFKGEEDGGHSTFTADELRARANEEMRRLGLPPTEASAISLLIPTYVGEKYDGRAGPAYKVLVKGKVKLTPEERKAEWSDKRSAVFKSVVNGKTWYVTHTHRCYNVTPTLKSCIKQFHDFVKGTAESKEPMDPITQGMEDMQHQRGTKGGGAPLLHAEDV